MKGTSASVLLVEVTKGEADAATRHGAAHSLVIVCGIRTDVVAGKVVATGGTVVAYEPWNPTPTDLVPTRFTWQPAAVRARPARLRRVA